MNNFLKKGYMVVKGFLSQEETRTMSIYLENSVNRGFFTRRDGDKDVEHDPSKLYCYADPLTEFLLTEKTLQVEKTVNKSLHPTYSFTRIYLEKDDLFAHTDRPACEYSVTVNVARVGEKWPLWIKDIDGNDHEIFLEPGDAVVYRGCDLLHWRKPMNETRTKLNAQFMLHYVDKNGPYSSCKWDERPKLGLSDTAKVR